MVEFSPRHRSFAFFFPFSATTSGGFLLRNTLTSTPSTKKTSATVAEDAKPWCSSGVGAENEAQAGSIVGGKKEKSDARVFSF